tara:strand:+ start:484 stop:2463 length:1980 start_codon:yes stop_codon:yes gene_type:complete
MSSASKKLIQAAGGAAGAADTGDDDFANVVLLLDGDGTSGDNNNTFSDSSTNNHTITRNGDVTQGSFSPYGDNWSNYFGGTGNYLTFSDDLSLRLGAGDFTIEFWINQSSKSSYQSIVSKGYISSGDYLVQTGNGDGNIIFYASGTAVATESGSTVNVGEWYHIAVVRNGTTVTIYRNGVSVATGTSSANLNTTSSLLIGQASTYAVNGYLSNVRIVKGTALYTSAFTPSTSPFTAITNTTLLTCQSNRFIDNSIYSHTATLTGTPKVTPFSPFKDDDARDITTDGGSGYFDGSGDYLSASSSVFSSPASTWTIEAWAYWDGGSTSGFHGVVGSWPASGYSSSNSFVMENVNGTMYFYYIYDSSSGNGISMGTFNAHEWNHFKVIKTATHYFTYKNGVQQSFTTVGTNFKGTTNNVTVGGYITGATAYWPGYISDVRIQSGGTSGNFTPPTSPLGSSSSTYLLTNFQDAGIYDKSGINNVDTVGNAQIDTAVKKYGTGSLEFDGTGDYLDTVSTEALTFGAGDFTVEFWINTSNNGNIMNPSTATGTGYWGLIIQSGNLRWNNSYAVTNLWEISASAIQDGSWHHVAISRASGSTKIFYDGTLQSTQSDTTNYSGTGAWRIGSGNLAAFNGYLDDFRITKGVARYTASFTAPNAELPKF